MNKLVQVNEVKDELKKRHYDISEKPYIQNGVILSTVAINKKEWNTIAEINIYGLISVNPSKTAAEIADMVESIISTHERIEKSIDKTFIIKNIHTAFQRIPEISKDSVLSRPTKFDGIEEYLCIYSRLGTRQEVMLKIDQKLLDKYDITEDEAWSQARHNNRLDATVIPTDDIIGENKIPVAVYIITNKIQRYGASAVIDKTLLRQLLGAEGDKRWLVALPSVHKAILIPEQDAKNTELTNRILKMFNNGNIEQIDRLTDKTYMAVI